MLTIWCASITNGCSTRAENFPASPRDLIFLLYTLSYWTSELWRDYTWPINQRSSERNVQYGHETWLCKGCCKRDKNEDHTKRHISSNNSRGQSFLFFAQNKIILLTVSCALSLSCYIFPLKSKYNHIK